MSSEGSGANLIIMDNRQHDPTHLGIGSQTRVGKPQIGGYDSEAGHIERLRFRAIGQLGRDHVEHAGGGDEFLRLQQRPQSV
jgi:hypothetical protein